MSISAQTVETVVVKRDHQKTARKSRIKIKFISVLEDSRCPIGTNCIWAGNAKVKALIIGPNSSETVEFNTFGGRNGAANDGWSIVLTSLTPAPKSDATLDPKKYVATFTVRRIQR